jgi:nucleoside-diphosphate-sugar epimerase
MVEETTPESVADLVEANFDLGVQLLHEAAMRECKCFVFAGSFWQLGGIENPGPNCLYADLKRSFSMLLETYGNRRGISTATLILHDVYGEADKRGKIINVLLDVARGKPSPSLTEGNQILDLTHVDDVAAAFEHALDYLMANATVIHEQWWVSGNRLTLKELAGMIEKIQDRELNFRWGEKQYSDKAIMEPLSGMNVPGWEPRIGIATWLARELNKSNNCS